MVLCVGRMVYKKGFDVLIRALADPALPGAQPGRGHGRRRRRAGEPGSSWRSDLGVAERLHWVGSVPKTEIGVYYNMADMLAMPSVSRPADGLNVCVLDAMSCGKPVVASTVAGNPLAVVDGVTGLLVPEQDPAALAAAVAALIDNPQRARRDGRGRAQADRGRAGLAAAGAAVRGAL